MPTVDLGVWLDDWLLSRGEDGAMTARARDTAAGIGLSLGLFILFKFALGLGLVAFPKGWF